MMMLRVLGERRSREASTCGVVLSRSVAGKRLSLFGFLINVVSAIVVQTWELLCVHVVVF